MLRPPFGPLGHLLLAFVLLLGCSPSDLDPLGPDAVQKTQIFQYQVVQLQPPDPSRVIVELEPSARPAGEIAGDYDLELLEEFPPHFAVFRGTYDLVELRDDPDIVEAAVNEPVETQGSDFSFGFYEGDWSESEGTNQEAFAKLGLSFLHSQTHGRGVRVMVADTGVDDTHRFLAPRLELLDPEVHLLGSIEPEPDDPSQAPAYGHGTHVSGCVLQIAPAVTIIPARILDHQGVGSLQDFVRALAAAMDPGLAIDLVNLSVSTSQEVPLVTRMVEALWAMDVVVVAAAGNYDPGTTPPPPSPLSLVPNAVGVAAVNVDDTLARYSRSGPGVDVSAPGTDIQSCYPGGGYTTGSGTSFATPLVAGSIALIMESTRGEAIQAMTSLRPDCSAMLPEAATDEGRVHPFATWVRLHEPDLHLHRH